jgi:hypothetical protein
MIGSDGATACRIACVALRPMARLAGVLSGSRVVASVATRGQHVALTIDDGPHPTDDSGAAARPALSRFPGDLLPHRGTGAVSPRARATHRLPCGLGTPLLLVTQYRDPRHIGRALARRAHPLGAVVVLHVGDESRDGVYAAAGALLVELARRNLRAITLSELATVPQ